MPRCLMAKKWKGYPWPDDRHDVRDDDEDEEIDVVGDAPSVGQIWGPSSPTAAATAPSPPPHASERIPPIIYNGYVQDLSHYTAYLPREPSATPPSYATLQPPAITELPPTAIPSTALSPTTPPPRTKSLAMCYTSTGAALSLPPKKKDIYRPYSLDDRPTLSGQLTYNLGWRPAEEDLSAAHAILDLSASTPALPPPHPPRSDSEGCKSLPPPPSKTIAYTYEAFFVSDGRSKKKSADLSIVDPKQKYTCSECGKQYATSSNLSRHKQTHRSLDSQSAKRCNTCGKTYVSMPALAMHLLTHKLNHACGVCGKLFSRPWLLQGHLRSHTGEKPYGCAHCGKAFADRSNLRAHMQTHSADKNYQCSRCLKTFALKSYLNKHLESACLDSDQPLKPHHLSPCPTIPS